MSRFAHTMRALRHRNYRLYLSGQCVSLMGTWMTRLALSWLTYRLTHSAFLLGMVGFAGQILTFVLAPFAGVWVDRMDRRKLLVMTQVAAAVQSLALAALTLAKVITIQEILALAALQGLIDAFDMPARQSFVTKMVPDKEDLSNAIALNSSMVNVARLVGPSVAAIVIAKLGEGWCFGIDGVSYLAVIASLLMMRIKPDVPGAHHRPAMAEQMREGWGYVSRFIPVRNILLLFAMTSLMGMSQMALLPLFAAQVLHGGPRMLGLLTTANAVGALVAAVLLASRKNAVGLLRYVQYGGALFGAALIVFGMSHWVALSLLAMVAMGFGIMTGMGGSNTIIQTLSPEEKRGRVMSFYTMAFIGMTPFGSLQAGALAHRIGAPHTLVFSGVCVLLAGACFWSQTSTMRLHIRARYEELGILQPKKEAA
ncbi:MFS transporter [Terriglobus sp. RCC_193]|uniref:MFS transporter n=1 Tax=Terriglobus sp. RCC_193 TaxID=3239218 RepID=UPI003525EA61